jgi:hypothetical protein
MNYHSTIEAEAAAPSLPLAGEAWTDERARADLEAADANGERPSIRALAERWQWSKSRVERFASKADAPSKEQMRTLMVNGLKDWDAKNGRQPGEPTPEEAADRVLSNWNGRDNPVRAAGQRRDTSGTDAGQKRDTDETPCWVVPRQHEIVVRPLSDGRISIEQEGQHGSAADDGGIIEVTATNVVGLARRILWAAGFETVLIAVGNGGGWSDLEDGDKPETLSRGVA